MNNLFSSRMVELRNEKGLSQKEVAMQLGISQALLSHYEKGIRECGLDFLCKVATYYDVSCDYLLGLIDTRRPFQEEFENIDVALDSEFRTSTLFRAATMLHDNISDKAMGKDEAIKRYFALAMYRLAISAAKAGCIPKSWLNIQDELSSTLSRAVIDQILSDIAQNRNEKSSKSISEPLCIKTVISNSEQILMKEINTFVTNSTKQI